jgi:excinuclease ABC subunit A
MDTILVRGARTHNLKNIDLDIPRDKLIVITGLSGSGKSSLAFDTLYAEGQRRYVESLSTYARQFLSMMEKPDIDHIEGLSPAISIEQKSTSHNPRSTVGTITEIYDYLRLLFARAGEPRCPDHDLPLKAQTVSQMVDQVLALPEGSKLMLLAPVVKDRKGEHLHLLDNLRRQGFIRARIDGLICDLDEAPALDKRKKHSVEVVVDRFKVKEGLGIRMAESFETALALAEGVALISYMDGDNEDLMFSAKFACPICNYSLSELEPKLFSFNNPFGACKTCDGLGIHQFFDVDRIIQHPEASIAEGAIRGWDRRSLFYFNMLSSLAEHYDFDIEKPWKDLSQLHQQKILFGSDDEEITFNYMNDRGTVFRRQHSFEGVIPNMERRYRDTESNSVREDLNKFMATSACPDCDGTRLCKSARNVYVDNKRIEDIVAMPVGECFDYFETIDLPGRQGQIAEKIIKEIRDRFCFLVDVGLNYLSLNRSAETLSGGEAQRIRLASQIGAGLVGVMYILDEPSIGLHQRDNERLLKTLVRLRDLGNTVIVVEHDEDAIKAADYIIDIGPGAGVHGGEIVAMGDSDAITSNPKSVTGQFLSGVRGIRVPKKRHISQGKSLDILGAKANNLTGIDATIPVGLFTCITGVSGSGKSSLINGILYPAAATALNKASTLKPAAHKVINGLEHFDKCIDINQSPIGRTPRSNPATYTGIFTPVRELFAGTQEARSRGYTPGRFSFNVKGGRCEACQGDGVTKVEMHFLPDIYVSCDVCKGKRYNRETLDITFKGKNIHQVLDMTIEDASVFFESIPSVSRKLQTLMDVGLSYIKLGQAATTLSGGEAQRVKLSKELSKRDTGKTLYILDEPTTGLHFHDIEQLLSVLHRLRDHGNTVVVIEHNLDVIKTADWILDLGPEGGAGGGKIVAAGTPEDVVKVKGSHTGRFLKHLL